MKKKVISIHAPMRGATEHGQIYDGDRNISIHAPRAGSDRKNHIFTSKYGSLFMQHHQKF